MTVIFTGVRTTGVHGEELPLDVEEADVGLVSERGVHQAAGLLRELRGRACESPRRRTASRVSVLVPGARSH